MVNHQLLICMSAVHCNNEQVGRAQIMKFNRTVSHIKVGTDDPRPDPGTYDPWPDPGTDADEPWPDLKIAL